MVQTAPPGLRGAGLAQALRSGGSGAGITGRGTAPGQAAAYRMPVAWISPAPVAACLIGPGRAGQVVEEAGPALAIPGL